MTFSMPQTQDVPLDVILAGGSFSLRRFIGIIACALWFRAEGTGNINDVLLAPSHRWGQRLLG